MIWVFLLDLGKERCTGFCFLLRPGVGDGYGKRENTLYRGIRHLFPYIEGGMPYIEGFVPI